MINTWNLINVGATILLHTTTPIIQRGKHKQSKYINRVGLISSEKSFLFFHAEIIAENVGKHLKKAE